MAQFALGLLAGITVGLVMEWVIDWSGLFPRQSTGKQPRKKPAQGKVVSGEKVTSSSAAPVAISSNTDIESNEE